MTDYLHRLDALFQTLHLLSLQVLQPRLLLFGLLLNGAQPVLLAPLELEVRLLNQLLELLLLLAVELLTVVLLAVRLRGLLEIEVALRLLRLLRV